MERFQNNQLAPEHLLLAMIEDNKGITRKIFNKLDVNIPQITADTEKILAKYPKIAYQSSSGQVYITNDFNKLIDNAQEEANRLKDQFISLDHILLAMA